MRGKLLLSAATRSLRIASGYCVDLKADMRGLKSHKAVFMQSEVAQDGSIAQIQLRIERIEKRLNLVDG